MSKSILLILTSVFLSTDLLSQVTKSTWLLSGNASFSIINYGSEGAIKYKQTNLEASPSIGYFIKDKFAIGLRPSLTYGSNNIGNSESIFAIGPFVRYYLLATDKIFNVITEGSYLYSSFNAGSKQNTLSLAAGPVLYFTPSVGLEFLVKYTSIKVINYAGSNNGIQINIGFQFNLEKEK